MPQLTLLLVILPPELNWSTIEVCSLVICACIPTFRAFLRLFPWISRLLDLSTQQSKFTTAPPQSSEILQEDGKDGIKVTTNVRIDHSNGDRDLEPTFIFNNNV
jgi:hypothetical protein